MSKGLANVPFDISTRVSLFYLTKYILFTIVNIVY